MSAASIMVPTPFILDSHSNTPYPASETILYFRHDHADVIPDDLQGHVVYLSP